MNYLLLSSSSSSSSLEKSTAPVAPTLFLHKTVLFVVELLFYFTSHIMSCMIAFHSIPFGRRRFYIYIIFIFEDKIISNQNKSDFSLLVPSIYPFKYDFILFYFIHSIYCKTIWSLHYTALASLRVFEDPLMFRAGQGFLFGSQFGQTQNLADIVGGLSSQLECHF